MVAVPRSRVGISVLWILFSIVGINSEVRGQDLRQAKPKWPLVHVPDPVATYVMGEVLERAAARLADHEGACSVVVLLVRGTGSPTVHQVVREAPSGSRSTGSGL
jgi:hypothetical protein